MLLVHCTVSLCVAGANAVVKTSLNKSPYSQISFQRNEWQGSKSNNNSFELGKYMSSKDVFQLYICFSILFFP